jgi:hypothetical protein
LQRDARDQIKDLDYFEEMIGPISQELPEDIKASLASISGLDIHYMAIRRALRNLSTRPTVEQKKAKAEQAVKGAQLKLRIIREYWPTCKLLVNPKSPERPHWRQN